ncbi:hypothetical protein ACF1G0_06610 [Streptomyces sp. NPDC013953]|uniref:hypothetical protein n=1 Tax=Streptomyces sp. NPDC013953 TaxID=3364868 RepID=UPI0037025847
MKHADAVTAETVAEPMRGAAPGSGAPGLLARVLLAAVPVVSLGMMGALPSLVIAWRRGARADWIAAVVFTAVTVAWLFQAVLTPVESHGWQFAGDLVLLSLATVGAALHCLLASHRTGQRR